MIDSAFTETGTLAVGDANIAYRIDGPVGAPWVVFSNSHATNLSLWDKQVADLAASYRVLRYDQRGHGNSPATGAPLRFDTLVDDLLALLDAHAVERATLVGVSMGAVTVLRLAARYPHRVTRVLAADGQWASPRGAHDLWAQRIFVARHQGMQSLATQTVGRWFRPAFVTARSQTVTSIERMIETTSVDGYCDCAAAMQRYDFSADFPRLSMPVHYVVGAQDGALLPVMRDMYRTTPNARMTEINDAGHLPNVEQPNVFNDILRAFLGESDQDRIPILTTAFHSMPRITLPREAELSDAQRAVYKATVAGRRGRAPAPLTAWLSSPELASRAQQLGEFVRYETSLAPRLSELAILVTARHWTSQYEWYAHKREALKAGLDEKLIEAIRLRQTPVFEHEDEAVVYAFACELHCTTHVSDELYVRAVSLLGETGTVELVGVLGYYTLVAMTLNTFNIGIDGTTPCELDRETERGSTESTCAALFHLKLDGKSGGLLTKL